MGTPCLHFGAGVELKLGPGLKVDSTVVAVVSEGRRVGIYSSGHI